MAIASSAIASRWRGVPTMGDPRLPFAVILFVYLCLGMTVLGFNRGPGQVILIIATAAVLDIVLHRLIRGGWLLPLSAVISGMSLAILVNFAHNWWLPLIPVLLAISSKYIFTYRGRHIFNPSLFGIVASLLLADNMISLAPAYQWGGSIAMAATVITTALVFFVGQIKRTPLIVGFLILYGLGLILRAWLVRHHVPLETILLGSLTSPAFYLFVFFMLTDPATSPNSRRGQLTLAAAIVVVELMLHKFESLYTLHYAAFICIGVRFLLLHIAKLWQVRNTRFSLLYPPGEVLRQGLVGGLLVALLMAIWQLTQHRYHDVSAGFELTRITAEHSGIGSAPGQLFAQLDDRIKPIGKWLLSVGDAVAAGDFDGDGRVDLFLTQPLKAAAHRGVLYRNMGGFRFMPVAVDDLARRVAQPQQFGLPSGALWVDLDNDGDSDLLVLMAFGHPLLYRNLLRDTGVANFALDRQVDLPYNTSLTANALDMNRDACLDLVIGNAINPYLADYDVATPLNPFRLPPPAYPGDRRMYHFMHRTWHNADNGGRNELYLGDCRGLRAIDVASVGLVGQRWTLDIGTGDIDGDGWTDLYLANDFGPDQLLLNRRGSHFETVVGRFVGAVGRDTYKGMNASIADLDGNGFPDIYVSNVHQALQAEGSLLWLNDGTIGSRAAAALSDRATQLGLLNEHRFGWGAAVGDLDRDGQLDVLQANGMVDDSYDRQRGADEACPDYWYWNARIALTGPEVHGYADRWADLRGRCIFPNEADRVFLKRDRYFVDAAQSVGFDHRGNTRGIALADLDNDGDLDVIVSDQFQAPVLYRNDAEPRGWIGLELIGDSRTCNRQALGTQVRMTAPLQQLREVQASNGFAAQNDVRLLFGLGENGGSVRFDINWCGGVLQRVELPSGRYHRIEQAGHVHG